MAAAHACESTGSTLVFLMMLHACGDCIQLAIQVGASPTYLLKGVGAHDQCLVSLPPAPELDRLNWRCCPMIKRSAARHPSAPDPPNSSSMNAGNTLVCANLMG